LEYPSGSNYEMAPSEQWITSPYSRFFNRLAVRFGWRCGIAIGIVIHSGPFLLAFVVWYVSNIVKDPTSDTFARITALKLTMPIAGLWIVLGPCLMVFGEIGFGRTLGELYRTSNDGWNRLALEKSVKRVKGLAWPIASSFFVLVIAAYLFSNNWLSNTLNVGQWPDPSWIIGLLVVSQIGISAGFGIWGIVQAVNMVRVATSTVEGPDNPPWSPLRPDQVPGMEALAFFAVTTAVVFSFGSVLAPAITIVAISAKGFVAVLLLIAVTVLLAGSAFLFLVPTFMIRSLAHHQTIRMLSKLSLEVEQAHMELRSTPSPTEEQYRHWSALLSYWLAVSRTHARPENLLILSRLPATVLVPILSLTATFFGLFLKL
jgi:hypothetical protein